MKNINAEIVKVAKLQDNLYHFTCHAPEIATSATSGQFVHIQIAPLDFAPMLRRPISIFNIDKPGGNIEFIFQIRGVGTEILAQKKVGDTLEILGPLGRGFTIGDYKKIAIIGGGIGTFPLHQLAKEYQNKADITSYFGFRNKNLVVLENEFKSLSNALKISTDDGSYGEKGYAVQLLAEDAKTANFDAIFACGPLPMLKAVKQIALDNSIYCEISLEERMGCAVGACMGCSVRLASKTNQISYARVCKDGPIFEANMVELG